MPRTIIYNARIVDDGKDFHGYIIVNGEFIEKIGEGLPDAATVNQCEEKYDVNKSIVIPGVIDVHVHFREPGLTHKADIESESRAALIGGVTSVLEMPNTNPRTTTLQALKDKQRIAAEKSCVNMAFYIGATNSNNDELLLCDYSQVPGIKVFMGSSTGNMLVDNKKQLDNIFSLGKLIAVHCEDEAIIASNISTAKRIYGNDVPIELHPEIRSSEACVKSTKFALELAQRHGTKLHLCHISTAREVDILPKNDNITAEACVAHLWFADNDYKRLGAHIKCNPAVKSSADRDALREGIRKGIIKIVSTDHAPHLENEKCGGALKAVSGMPMVQFSLPVMMKMAHDGIFDIPTVVSVMANNPAKIFRIEKRGYLRPGYFADITILEEKQFVIAKEIIASKCGWSPLEGETMPIRVGKVFVNGALAYNDGKILPHPKHRLTFS
ncbi:MAG: dihydroorotase [Prevotella sp.]|nr:dihydroorotase [Bacteroides sp.]MCM1366083.1 dihydroorotase [Prevotella sp.]MCM1436568.1 dihydroorotase [Prevotella sp.]